MPLAQTENGGWICTHYDALHPVDLVRYGEDGERPVSQACRKNSIDAERLVAAEDFRWRSVDGMEIQGWLYRTPGEKLEPSSWSAARQVMPKTGSTPRSSTWPRAASTCWRRTTGQHGVRSPFQESIKQDGWGGREQEDIRCGIEALIDANLADPDALALRAPPTADTRRGGRSRTSNPISSPPQPRSAV